MAGLWQVKKPRHANLKVLSLRVILERLDEHHQGQLIHAISVIIDSYLTGHNAAKNEPSELHKPQLAVAQGNSRAS